MSILAFLFFYFINAQEKIISFGDEWQYYDEEQPIPDNWYADKSVTKTWRKGNSPLGYGEGSIATKISYGSKKSRRDVTKYFTKSFTINKPYRFLAYQLSYRRDDGVIFYLNGVEIHRDNMPSGNIDRNTKSKSIINSPYEDLVHSKLLFPENFVEGTNIISASVHQGNRSSSDCFFDVELIGDNDPKTIPSILKESTLKNIKLNSRLVDIDHKNEIKNKNLEIEFLQQSKDNNISLFIFICAILFLTIMLTVYILSRYYIKFNTSKKDIEQLKTLLFSKEREMMSLSLNAISYQQLLKDIKQNMKSMTESSITKRDINKLLKQIDNNLDYNEDWENLKKHFSAVHSDFFKKIKKLYPTLSEVELRHCIFIKLHMQTKEIAKTLHIDPRSVQVARYRIKKKMGLAEHINLREYLFNL